MLSCPNCGGVEVSSDELRTWRIHFSALPDMLATALGMREARQIVADALWKLGHYDKGEIWMGRWLWYPKARDWLKQMPKTPQTILLYLGPPPDLNLLADLPPENILDASELISVDDARLHVDMRRIDNALQRSANAPLSPNACVFRQEGDSWRLVFAGKAIWTKHVKGMFYIRRLLEIAPEEESILQLRRVADPDFQPEIIGSANKVIDERTLKEIHQRLAAIESEQDAAREMNDFGTQQNLAEEREALNERLRVDLGLGGRIRKTGDLKSNQTAVSNAITTAIKNIAKVHPELGSHLNIHISKGSLCSYHPEPGIVWST